MVTSNLYTGTKDQKQFDNSDNIIEINNLLQKLKPHLISISKCQAKVTNKTYSLKHNNYNIETTKIAHITKLSRTGLMLSNKTP